MTTHALYKKHGLAVGARSIGEFRKVLDLLDAWAKLRLDGNTIYSRIAATGTVQEMLVRGIKRWRRTSPRSRVSVVIAGGTIVKDWKAT